MARIRQVSRSLGRFKSLKSGALLTGMCLLLALIWPVISRESISEVVEMAWIPFLAGSLVPFLPMKLIMPGWFVGTMAAGLLAADEPGVRATAIMFFWTGFVLFFMCVRNVLFEVKKSMSTVRVTWDEGKQRPELDAPSWGVVKARIEGLRGGDRSMLTVFNDQKRLDVCCTEPDKFLVIFTAALGHDREDVYQAVPVSPAAVDPRDLIEVEFGGLPGRYPAGRFVPQATAVAAARTFLTTGERDTSLVWDQETRHHEIVKPPTLPQG